MHQITLFIYPRVFESKRSRVDLAPCRIACVCDYIYTLLSDSKLLQDIQCLPSRPTRRYPGWALLGVPSTTQLGLWEN